VKAVVLGTLLVMAPAAARAQDPWAAPPRPPAYAPPPPDYGPPPAAAAPPMSGAPPAAPLPEGAHVAQPGELCYPAPPPGQTHDGFYLRLQAGPAYISARQGNTTYQAAGAAMGFALGAVVLPNLALFGSFFFHFGDQPTIKTGGTSMSIPDSTLQVSSFGAGLAYYVMPINVYVAAAVAGTDAQLTDKNQNRLASSNSGLGFQVMAGKEWWVGREWGLGAAAELTGAWMKDTDDSTVSWNAFTYSLLFSATYN